MKFVTLHEERINLYQIVRYYPSGNNLIEFVAGDGYCFSVSYPSEARRDFVLSELDHESQTTIVCSTPPRRDYGDPIQDPRR